MKAKVYTGIKQFAEKLAKKKGISVKSAEEQVKDVMDTLKDILLDTSADGIQLIDFITLQRKKRASRVGRNPRTNEEIQIPERWDIKCSLGKRFELDLNK